VLNGEPYLCEMLESLEGQTFRNFTVLLWDNGSSDATVEKARKWIPSRLPGRVVSDIPLPLHECLARMVEESETEFCARMDADDICYPTRFERQLEEFNSNPSLLVLGTQAEFIDPEGNATGEGSRFPLEYCDILSGMLVENQLLHPTVMFRKKAILDAGNYAFEKPCEDYDLWLRVAALGAICNLADTLLSYRQHDKSILAKARELQQLEEPNLLCMDRHSEKMFGISPKIYRELRLKVHFLSVLLLIPAIIHIAGRSGVTVLRVLCSASFLYSARCLTARNDLISRGGWGLFQRIGKSLPIFS